MIDEWNGLAVLLADMIEKYAGELELDALPDPMFPEEKAAKHKILNETWWYFIQ